MQTSTIIIFTCLIAVVVAHAHHDHYPVVDAEQEAIYNTLAHDRSPRTKRSLLLLKKKLLLGKIGALGLKAAKVGAVGVGVAGVGIAGALAFKSKAFAYEHPPSYLEVYSHPQPYIDAYGWSG